MSNTEFVQTVQRWLGVSPDGIAGPATLAAWERLSRATGPVKTTKSLANAPAFFDVVREKMGPLKPPQVEGFNVLLVAMRHWPVTWVAYGLATALHETARTMQPIKEYGGDAYFRQMYDINGNRPTKARELGNLLPGDGVKYAGRGYVQLTGRTNYERYGIAHTPDDALKPDIAATILIDGMEKGRFTGKKLADYLPGDYVNARRIINGTDKAADIAAWAKTFERALNEGQWQ